MKILVLLLSFLILPQFARAQNVNEMIRGKIHRWQNLLVYMTSAKNPNIEFSQGVGLALSPKIILTATHVRPDEGYTFYSSQKNLANPVTKIIASHEDIALIEFQNDLLINPEDFEGVSIDLKGGVALESPKPPAYIPEDPFFTFGISYGIPSLSPCDLVQKRGYRFSCNNVAGSSGSPLVSFTTSRYDFKMIIHGVTSAQAYSGPETNPTSSFAIFSFLRYLPSDIKTKIKSLPLKVNVID